MRKVPDFVPMLNDVTPIDSFLQFRVGPGAHETALGLGVDAMVTAFGSTEAQQRGNAQVFQRCDRVRQDGTDHRVVESYI